MSLSDAEKRRRGLAMLGAGLTLWLSHITLVRAAGSDAQLGEIFLQSGAMALLFQFVLFCTFIGYLAQWKHVSGRETTGQSVTRFVVMPIAVLVASQFHVIGRVEQASLGDVIASLIAAILAYASIVWAASTFYEVRRGSDPNQDRLSHGYASILYLRNPPRTRADIILLDAILAAVIAYCAYKSP